MRVPNALLAYFALALGISWTGALVAATYDRLYLLFVSMLLGPSIASLGLTATLEGAHGLRELGRRLRRWRVGARWYAALLVAPALVAVVLGVLSRTSPGFLPGLAAGASPRGVLAYALIAGFGAGIFEELGWTGFATPRLLRRRGWLPAGLWLGLFWAAWHVLPDYLGRTTHGPLWLVHIVEWFVALAAYRVLMTWIYSHTRSLLLGILMHVSFTGSQALLWPTAASPAEELVWYGAFACGIGIVVAVVILAVHRFTSVAASAAENTRTLAGDGLVPDPMFTVTHAITIAARPDDVWPWLAQMGSHRGGWYSYDRIDNGGRPSAHHVLAECQHVAPGDVLPALPGATDAFIVAAVEPPRDLVVIVRGEGGGGPIVSWEHLVEPVDTGHSRLIVRGRVARGWKLMAREARTAGKRPVFIERVYRVLGRIPDTWTLAIAALGHRWMEARHLRGIKRRAEAGATP